MKKELEAYQRAFNSINNLMEYKGLTRLDFEGIALRLVKDLAKVYTLQKRSNKEY